MSPWGKSASFGQSNSRGVKLASLARRLRSNLFSLRSALEEPYSHMRRDTTTSTYRASTAPMGVAFIEKRIAANSCRSHRPPTFLIQCALRARRTLLPSYERIVGTISRSDFVHVKRIFPIQQCPGLLFLFFFGQDFTAIIALLFLHNREQYLVIPNHPMDSPPHLILELEAPSR